MLWAERSMKTFLEELINHKAWECKHAEFKITYVQFVSLQSSLIKLGNELQQRMQDRRLRGHEHRHKINNEIRTLWCKTRKKVFSHSIGSWTKKKTEDVNKGTYILNIPTWPQRSTNIYSSTMNVTHRVMEGKATCPHLYSLKVQNSLQTSCRSNCNYSDFDQPLWVVKRLFPSVLPLHFYSYVQLCTREVHIFNLHFTEKFILLQNNLNCSKKNYFFARSQCARGIHSLVKFVTVALVTLPKRQTQIKKFLSSTKLYTCRQPG